MKRIIALSILCTLTIHANIFDDIGDTIKKGAAGIKHAGEDVIGKMEDVGEQIADTAKGAADKTKDIAGGIAGQIKGTFLPSLKEVEQKIVGKVTCFKDVVTGIGKFEGQIALYAIANAAIPLLQEAIKTAGQAADLTITIGTIPLAVNSRIIDFFKGKLLQVKELYASVDLKHLDKTEFKATVGLPGGKDVTVDVKPADIAGETAGLVKAVVDKAKSVI